ncbi:hypothetical protein IGI04_036481 [Brassica rapa subsp. trilocularis]|uniref:Uncharacterized protein n=1 Tax=Brassica rapa subsp. trilocularis TaxID=1813537 RepID=A0ABQ7LIF0_BRACM|nr:hypothetical protein IGI04_036481 [Brassica rapa subsp. trilocularis]
MIKHLFPLQIGVICGVDHEEPRKPFLEVLRYLQNCNTILRNDGFTSSPYAFAEPCFINMPCNYAGKIIGSEPTSCLS